MKKASAAFIAFIWRVLKGKTSHCCYVVAELHCPWHSAKAVSQLWILVPSCFLHEIGVSCLYFKGKDPSLWKQFECCMPQLTLLLVFVVLSRAGLWIAQTLYLGTSEPKKRKKTPWIYPIGDGSDLSWYISCCARAIYRSPGANQMLHCCI